MSQQDNNDFDKISFDLPKNQSNVIKVIGVGGGGSNAINHMFRQGIRGVDFVVCNTDSQALENSPVPTKIQLGVNLTEGLGAGANPDVGEQAALESFDDIKNLLSTNTKMVFITAGMGGGTGTGAAPIIAKQAREMDILTVGIITIPFMFEGKTRNEQAQLGVEKLRDEVDSLIVINNNKLREVYGNLGFKAGFSKADEVLATASRGIAEVITHHYTQNIDLKDAKTVLSNSGTAIMGSSVASGSNRAMDAIEKALDSPLLNDNKIKGAQNVLLLIVSGTDEITIDEIGEINDHIQAEAGNSANIIMGVGEDESLEDSISITVIATGFNTEQQDVIVNTETKKIVHTLEDEQKAELKLDPKKTSVSSNFNKTARPAPENNYPKKKIVHSLEEDNFENDNPLQNQENKSVTSEAETNQNNEISSLNEDDLLATTSAMREIEVDAEEVHLELNDFEIEDVNPNNQEAKNQANENNDFADELPLTFDFPIQHSVNKQTEKTANNELEDTSQKDNSKTDETNNSTIQHLSLDDSLEDSTINDIEVKDEIVVSSEANNPSLSNNEAKLYNLDDYEDLENHLNQAQPQQASEPKQEAEETSEEEFSFEVKKELNKEVKKEDTNATEEVSNEIDPFSSSIQDLKASAAQRRAKLKRFNYQFKNNQQNIDEIEKQPAYKRAGVEIDHSRKTENKRSRTSLQQDENGNVNFRSNNSYLHDNVD
ncbi:MAG: cell division protein FtsZ [Psychroflexus maritimus]